MTNAATSGNRAREREDDSGDEPHERRV
jgi:hypothetical protein